MAEVHIDTKDWSNFGGGYEKENYLRTDENGMTIIETVDRWSRPLVIGALQDLFNDRRQEFQTLPNAIDLCGGGLPVGPAYTSPLLAPNGVSDWTDISPANVARGARLIEDIRNDRLGGWQAHENNLSDCDQAWENAITLAGKLGVAKQLNIDNAPEGMYAAATMLCGAESSTDDMEVYEGRLLAFARSVEVGGILITAWSEQSTHYYAGTDEHGNRIKCPAVPIDRNDIERILGGVVRFAGIGFVASPAEASGPHSWTGLGWAVGERAA